MKRGSFNSKLGFILAASGSAVGLGNIWKFPFEVSNGGGAAFLIMYLFFCTWSRALKSILVLSYLKKFTLDSLLDSSWSVLPFSPTSLKLVSLGFTLTLDFIHLDIL